MTQAAPQDNRTAASPADMLGGLGAHEAGQSTTDDTPAPLLALFQDKRRQREDLRLLHQALNHGWDPPNKAAITDALNAMIDEPDLKPRVLIRCIWAVLKMDQFHLNTANVVLGMRVDHPRMLTPWQSELRALLKSKPHLRARIIQQWRNPDAG